MCSVVGRTVCLSKPATMMIMSGFCSTSHAVSSAGLNSEVSLGLVVEGVWYLWGKWWVGSLFFIQGAFCCYIFVSLFGVKILNIILCMLRRGVYACVRRWAICIRPRGLWLSTGIDVCLWQVSKVYMMVSVSIPRRCMRIDSVRF